MSERDAKKRCEDYLKSLQSESGSLTQLEKDLLNVKTQLRKIMEKRRNIKKRIRIYTNDLISAEETIDYLNSRKFNLEETLKKSEIEILQEDLKKMDM